MRPLEVLVLLLLLAAPLSLLSEGLRRHGVGFVLGVLGATLALIQLLIDGYRWSMIPVYALAAVWLILSLVALARRRARARGDAGRGRSRLRVVGAVAGVVAWMIAAAPAYFFPVFTLPAPTGSRSVGVTWDAFVPPPPSDGEAPAWYLRREVSLQIWYPAAPGGDPLPYVPAEGARALARSWSSPPFVLQHFSQVQTHGHTSAPVAETGGRFPVVLFSLSGLMIGCTTLAEDLASHGYVVVSVGHRDARWTPFVFDGDGRAIALDPDDERSRALSRELESDAVEHVKGRILQSPDAARKAQLAQELVRVQPLNTADVRLCAFEISRTLDRLEELDRGDGSLAGRLDRERVAVLGFSKGGAVAGQACLQDRRLRAGINMDGFMYGDIATEPLPKPFLFMHSVSPHHPDALINDVFFRRSAQGSLMLQIRGSRHGNFGDPSIWNLQRQGPGPIDGQRMIAILRAYVRAFLDRHLRGTESELLRGEAGGYPEVRIWVE